uniref:Uncharacterized protein n=1 Tax=Ascaris lumbricoides TaxID=6252 RepID=A0A0M3INH7_ASCLU
MRSLMRSSLKSMSMVMVLSIMMNSHLWYETI